MQTTVCFLIYLSQASSAPSPQQQQRLRGGGGGKQRHQRHQVRHEKKQIINAMKDNIILAERIGFTR